MCVGVSLCWCCSRGPVPAAWSRGASDESDCVEGSTRCGDACVDLRTDDTNCGRCEDECHADERCVSGECRDVCCRVDDLPTALCLSADVDEALVVPRVIARTNVVLHEPA